MSALSICRRAGLRPSTSFSFSMSRQSSSNSPSLSPVLAQSQRRSASSALASSSPTTTPLRPSTTSFSTQQHNSVSTTYTSNTRLTSQSRTAQISRHLSSGSAYTQPPSGVFSSPKMGYSVRKIGAPNTLEHRVYIEKDGQPISPFHDIPLYANEQQTILNMVVEIPRWTNGKLEVSLYQLFELSPLRCRNNPALDLI